MQMTLQGVNNVYTRHVPPFVTLAEQALKGRLKESHFPGINGVVSPPNKAAADVILFIVGGATFEETTKIAEINAAAPQVGREGKGGREEVRKQRVRKALAIPPNISPLFPPSLASPPPSLPPSGRAEDSFGLQHDPQLDLFPRRDPSAFHQARIEQQHPFLPPCLVLVLLPTGDDGNWRRKLTAAVTEGVGVRRRREGGRVCF